jgi:hypothetical protein
MSAVSYNIADALCMMSKKEVKLELSNVLLSVLELMMAGSNV